ncbi:hypothetical protein ILUMI_12093 [Ignelater luminosus]|uniref:non-specific serine/threonine protein kinase n=1 Tax=Ignelater luminosus TaxID=2038154 RepID=A0A8K0CUS9_IGNLU|nr:hypothetical protein ILUMI_12093 [Ignelater luminosus]
MNTLGLSLIMKMGCFCSREIIYVNNTKYEIKEKLGEGGFSTIDLVENTFTKKRYALKRIICHSIDDQKIALQEIEYYKKLKHPNIIELIDSTFKGSADIVINATSEVYMVLPYYRRGTLHDYLEIRSFTKNYLDIKEILRIFIDILRAVKYMHDMKPEALAHRDLKTSNVCLTDGLSPVVMDLGSVAPAKVQVCGSQDAQKLQDIAAERCSMPYRAPELFNVKSYCVIDQRTDIWSLACVLYAMCYFKSPFDAVYERGDSVALAVMSGKINFPEDTPFTQDAHDLILFMLKEDPTERPFIDDVISKSEEYRRALENNV